MRGDAGRTLEITRSQWGRVDAFAAIRLVAGTTGLAIAALADWRTRRVGNRLWIGLATLGLLLLAVELNVIGAGLPRYALLIAAAALFYPIFFGEPLRDERGFHFRPVRAFALGGAGALMLGSVALAVNESPDERMAYAQLLTMPLLVLLYQGLYRMRLLHGGADAKAMIAITLLVPTYPDASPFPLFRPGPTVEPAMALFFPFSLVVLVDAAILFLAFPVAFLLYNGVRGDLRFPQALFGYRRDLETLPPHVWLMERIDAEGQRVLVLLPRREKDQAEQVGRLREHGVARTWVQPKIPFMIPLLVGFGMAFLVGNALFVLLSL